MTSVNADLFRIAHRFAGREETRYYLSGVCIEKHPDMPGATGTPEFLPQPAEPVLEAAE